MPLHDPQRRSFFSDNLSGVHPEVLEAIVTADGGAVDSYGDDPYTARLQDVMAAHFRCRDGGLPGPQRHRRQCAEPEGGDAALGGGDHP